MYRRNKGEKLKDASPGDERRSFLRKAAVTALGGAVATLGLKTSTAAKASTMPKQGPHIKKPQAVAALRQVRDVLRMQDEPLRVSLSTLGREVAELVPYPPERLRLDRARPNYFLVLSNSCSTCQTIGSGLAAPASRWECAITVLVASDSERHGQEWAASVGLDSPWVFVDDQGKYAKQLGVSSSPTVVRVERGRLTAAANLTSLRSSRSSSTGSRPTDRPATRAGQDRRCKP